MPLFFFFLRNSSYSSPPGPNNHLASHSSAWPSPKTPAVAPAPGLVLLPPLYRTGPGPGDLIVLKHSSYRQIFQCPLSLVSDLHICWKTVGYLLCSSDQLGISLALRGSGLRSHLCCHHLLKSSNLYILIPAAFPPFSPSPLPADNPPNNLHIYDSVSLLLVFLVFKIQLLIVVNLLLF